ncbi:MAG: DUF2318 domain-containing protein [Deltaproteobacteria bacterium]|nr:DUF2318 domain-containing protein [Deltaproteobacteria bacterium]
MSKKSKNIQARKESFKEKHGIKESAAKETEEKKGSLPFIIIAVCLISLIIAFFVFNRNRQSVQALSKTDFVTRPAALFNDGKARHFEFEADDGVLIKYFVLKSSDGVIRAAFDACDVCWPSGKGYYQDGDYMVCRNCGRRFASVKVNEVKGGCNPAPLYRKVEGGDLVIQVADILEGRQYFNFSERG